MMVTMKRHLDLRSHEALPHSLSVPSGRTEGPDIHGTKENKAEETRKWQWMRQSADAARGWGDWWYLLCQQVLFSTSTSCCHARGHRREKHRERN